MELFTPDFGLIFWMFVSFGILFLILWRLAWPVILKSIDSRADLIDKGVEYAQNAKEQLDNAHKQAQQYITDAQKQQAQMLRDADKMKNQIIEEARTEAQKEAQKVMEQAKLSIQQQQKEAEQEFRNSVSDFALQIAQKVVKQEMTDDKNRTELVDKLLNEMESQN